MSVELLQILSLAFYVLAAVLLVVAISLFFGMQIPKIIGDLTGRTEKRAIKSIRQQNESSEKKSHKFDMAKKERGAVTDRISPSGRIEQKYSGVKAVAQTEKIGTEKLSYQSEETTVLNEVNETTVLNAPSSETTVLNDQPLNNQNSNMSQPLVSSSQNLFKVDVEIGFAESVEIIE